jgi:hypothetical protein
MDRLEAELRDIKDQLADLKARARDADERVLILEAMLGRPMSLIDRMIAERTAARRYEEHFLGPEALNVARDRRA